MRIKNNYNVTYTMSKTDDTITAVTALVTVENFDTVLTMISGMAEYARAINESNVVIPSPSSRLFVGVARLKEGDVNDVEKAKDIARAKAFRKANKEMKNLVIKYREEINKGVKTIDDLINGTLDKVDEYQSDIDNLTAK